MSHTSNRDKTWHRYKLPKEDLKNIQIAWHTTWVLITSAFFHQRSASFAVSINADIDWVSIQNF